jgi:hypothetical protein
MRLFLEWAKDIALVLVILAGANRTIAASNQTVNEHNFAIEFPSNWHALNPPPAPMLAAVQSPDRLKTILIFAQKAPENQAANVLRGMMAGSRQSGIDKGWQIINEHVTSIDAVPFNVVVTRGGTNSSIVNYFGAAGDEIYLLSGTHRAGNADSDEELLTSIKSFRLLARRSIPGPSQRVSNAYRAGYVVGRVLGVLTMVAFIGGCVSG